VGRHESAEEKCNVNESEFSRAKGEITELLAAEGHKKRYAIGLRSILEYYLIGATAKQGAHLPYCGTCGALSQLFGPTPNNS
jgi:hypothetical protein